MPYKSMHSIDAGDGLHSPFTELSLKAIYNGCNQYSDAFFSTLVHISQPPYRISRFTRGEERSYQPADTDSKA